MARVLVVGGFADEADREAVGRFCAALGAEIHRQGHILVSANRSELDRSVAEAVKAACEAIGENPSQRIVSWILKDKEPHFNFGRQFESRLNSWDPGVFGIDFTPEPFSDSDATILIKGGAGTNRAAHWTRNAGNPLLPVAYFGGSARRIYEEEADRFDVRYGAIIERDDYATLNERGSDWIDKARRIINLGERIISSGTVSVAMPYVGDAATLTQLDNLFDSYLQVCERFQYRCELVNERNTQERLIDAIQARIQSCDFVLVDLTSLRPNVLYELGYAEGLDKQVIITARVGTELPFDVRDRPVLFWDPIDLRRLREDLNGRVSEIAAGHGRPTEGR